MRTTDGGLNWTTQESGTINHLFDVVLTDSNNGIIIGGNGTILNTTNGGQNWINRQSGLSEDLIKLSFSDSNTGLIVGSSGIILRTSNGGLSWERVSSGTTEYLSGVSFVNDSFGVVVGSNGNILRTSDSGVTWGNQQSGTTNFLSAVQFTNVNTGWAVGNSGTILHTINGGGISCIENENNYTQPEEYLLLQNYPNPFNPSTKISWQTPVGGWQTLKIYDVLGNEIAVLVDEYKNSGTYEVVFNASYFPSGVYFYRIQSGNFIDTKKLILLK